MVCTVEPAGATARTLQGMGQAPQGDPDVGGAATRVTPEPAPRCISVPRGGCPGISVSVQGVLWAGDPGTDAVHALTRTRAGPWPVDGDLSGAKRNAAS